MVDKASSPTEEAGSIATGTPPGKEPARAFLQLARKDLSEEELSSPGVRRFLIAEIERLDTDCVELRTIRDRYNEQRVELAVLQESSKASKFYELLSFVTLSVGSAGLGAAPSYFAINGAASTAWVVLILSCILVMTGIAARVFK